MSDWAWVAFAYGIVYVTLAVYVASLTQRSRRLRTTEHPR